MTYPLVSTQWLSTRLHDDNIVILDASMKIVLGKEPLVYDRFECIPNSQNLDLETDLFDHDSAQSHAMPSVQQFIDKVQSLGINNDSLVVIYDNQGIYSSPRAWWTFKVMGFDNVFVLDGGLPLWIKESRPTANEYTSTTVRGNASAAYQANRVCDAQHVLTNIASSTTSIIDARGAGRFNGSMPEPREGMRSGHIPSSLNIPFAQVLNDLQMKPSAELQSLFNSIVSAGHSTRIFSCGSGITACILILASFATGHNQAVLYDGSWAEWGGNPNLPIE